MIVENNINGSLVAVAFNETTLTYQDLKYYLLQENRTLSFVSPDDIDENFDNTSKYINLITDTTVRQKVTNKLDHLNAQRFSYVHPTALYDTTNAGLGIFVYPQVQIYPNVVLGNDIIIHSQTLIAHGSRIGNGSFISGGTMIGGSCNIGDMCWIGLHVTLYDKITIVDNCVIGANTTIRKNVIEPGVYAQLPQKLKKLNKISKNVLTR